MPDKMYLAQYIVERLKQAGVKSVSILSWAPRLRTPVAPPPPSFR